MGDLTERHPLQVPGLQPQQVLEQGAVLLDLLNERQASGSDSPST